MTQREQHQIQSLLQSYRDWVAARPDFTLPYKQRVLRIVSNVEHITRMQSLDAGLAALHSEYEDSWDRTSRHPYPTPVTYALHELLRRLQAYDTS